MVKQYQKLARKNDYNNYSVQRISKNRYQIDSKKSMMTYVVTKTMHSDIWSCQCYDFIARLRRGTDDKRCKHISYLTGILNVEHQIQNSIKVPTEKILDTCLHCPSTDIVKAGFRKTKRRGDIQLWKCNDCKKRFTDSDSGFARVRVEPSVISEALNMVMSGMSRRAVAEHLLTARDISVSHVAITQWVKKYTIMIREYVDALKPTIGNTWSVDEKMINVRKTKPIPKKGYYDWLWSAIDPKTRFLLATKISKSRPIKDAKTILEKTLQNAQRKPEYIITDSLKGYSAAIDQQFGKGNIAHIKTNAIKDGFTNLPIERYHNEISANLKPRRGLDNDDSAQIYADLLRIHHNFIRPHMGLDGQTPASVAGLDNVDVSKKYRSLITAAANKRNHTNDSEVVSILGDLIKHVNISSDDTCIKITPKGWVDNVAWAEINTILLKFGFKWFFNNYLRCWVAFQIRLQYNAKMSKITQKNKSAV